MYAALFLVYLICFVSPRPAKGDYYDSSYDYDADADSSYEYYDTDSPLPLVDIRCNDLEYDPKGYTIIAGDKLQLICYAIGENVDIESRIEYDANFDYKWVLPGHLRLDEDDHRITYAEGLARPSELVIHRTQLSDTGTYTCVAIDATSGNWTEFHYDVDITISGSTPTSPRDIEGIPSSTTTPLLSSSRSRTSVAATTITTYASTPSSLSTRGRHESSVATTTSSTTTPSPSTVVVHSDSESIFPDGAMTTMPSDLDIDLTTPTADDGAFQMSGMDWLTFTVIIPSIVLLGVALLCVAGFGYKRWTAARQRRALSRRGIPPTLANNMDAHQMRRLRNLLPPISCNINYDDIVKSEQILGSREEQQHQPRNTHIQWASPIATYPESRLQSPGNRSFSTVISMPSDLFHDDDDVTMIDIPANDGSSNDAKQEDDDRVILFPEPDADYTTLLEQLRQDPESAALWNIELIERHQRELEEQRRAGV